MQKVIHEPPILTESTARELLEARGYGMSCCFGHVHATQGNREWHICMLDALATMEVAQFFACLHAALVLSQQVPGSLFPLVDTRSEGA